MHSNLSAILLSIILAVSIGLHMNHFILLSLISVPFFADAVIGFAIAYHSNKVQNMDYLRQELLEEGSSVTQKKSILPETIQTLLD